MFCDHGANIYTKNESGQYPFIYAANKGYDDICMYTCMRMVNVDICDENTGLNLFTTYLVKRDFKRMK